MFVSGNTTLKTLVIGTQKIPKEIIEQDLPSVKVAFWCAVYANHEKDPYYLTMDQSEK